MKDAAQHTLSIDDFSGTWRLVRDIDDKAAGLCGRFAGRCDFDPAAEADMGGRGARTLICRETGRVSYGLAPEMAAESCYLWKFGTTEVEILFDDGRPFHRFVPMGLARGTDHRCGADLYRVAYDFSAFPRWEVRWEVRGPRKDYRLLGRYEPA